MFFVLFFFGGRLLVVVVRGRIFNYLQHLYFLILRDPVF